MKQLSLALTLACLLAAIPAGAASLNVTYPSNDATLDGAVVIRATGSSDLWWTQLKADGLSVGTSGPNLAMLWNTTSVYNGWHTLTLNGYAEWSNSPSVSTTVNVYVDNTGNGQLYFATYGPHTPLPSEYWCAAVIPQSPETVPQNATANATEPTASQIAAFHAGQPSWIGSQYMNAVDGAYSGSTDMIIRWAACKWGIDEELARAAVWGESSGIQAATGDWTSDYSQCPAGGDFYDGECAATYGITGIRETNLQSTFPLSWTSTAFAVDFRFAQWRACMDGASSNFYGETPAAGYGYPTYPNGGVYAMTWGCIESWYSGAWYGPADDLWYIGYIQGELVDKRWLN